MAIVGRAKYTHARAREILRQRDAKGAPKISLSRRVASKFRARACVYFTRPTIAIAKIRDYSQSTFFFFDCLHLERSHLAADKFYKEDFGSNFQFD